MAISLNIELTDHCNISCGMCSQSMRKEAHGVPKRFISWETWTSTLRNLENFPEEVHLCPHWLGEPTLHPEFEKLLHFAFTENHQNRWFRKLKLHTNAVLFDQKRGQALLDLVQLSNQQPDTFHFVHFSIDAFSRESYQKVKGVDYRERVYSNVISFLALREKLALSYPKITIAFVIQEYNYKETLDFYHFWQNIWSQHNKKLKLCTDWPNEEKDSIYFRRLNCAEQEKSDLLYVEALSMLGVNQNPNKMRNIESF